MRWEESWSVFQGREESLRGKNCEALRKCPPSSRTFAANRAWGALGAGETGRFRTMNRPASRRCLRYRGAYGACKRKCDQFRENKDESDPFLNSGGLGFACVVISWAGVLCQVLQEKYLLASKVGKQRTHTHHPGVCGGERELL